MYPFNYLQDDYGLNLALLAPLVIAVFVAEKLPREIRKFLWKNYWWLCAIAFTWFGSNYTGNISELLLYGGVGAFAGLIGSTGFDPKDIPDKDYSESEANNKSSHENHTQKNTTLGDSYGRKNQVNRQLITDNKIDQPKNGIDKQLLPDDLLNSDLTSAALDIVIAQRRIYDEGIWKEEKEKLTANIQSDLTDNISGFAWKLDRSRGILWNESTKEVLESASALGFSYAVDHLIIYNKVKPRKIRLSEIRDAKYE
jgi:hypothetical protein